MAVTDFLCAATALLQTVSVGSNTNSNSSGEVDLDQWIDRFEDSVTALGHDHATSSIDREVRVERACWKISQDVLIRLRRLKEMKTTAYAESSNEDLETQLHLVFTEQDMEILRTRLFEIQTRWQSLRQMDPHLQEHSSTSYIPSQLPNTFSNLAIPDDEPQSTSGFPHAAAGATNELLQEFILESLSFPSMDDREQDVAKAHGNSFNWIFDENVRGDSLMADPRFTKWLSSDELGSIYWITGKAGSGKSTLMRYLSQHRETRRLLQAWAGNKQVATAEFYFWVSGSEDQRSRVGLLRSLLHQLLSLYPGHIPAAFPRLWQKLTGMTSKERIAMGLEWAGPDLTSGFLRLLHTCLSTVKICLFVDGLDELDGDHESMIHFFRNLETGRHASQVKMCLSSRPWEVFERAFARSVLNLKLEELILDDMTRYTYDSLRENQHVRRALRQDADNAPAFVQEVVKGADGVFLWTRLVVREIIRKFNSEQTTVSDMRDFLSNFPTDLGDLFQKLLLKDQSEKQLVETSQLFQLVHAREVVAYFIKDESATSLSIWQMAFASKTEEDHLALTRSAEEATDETIIHRCAETQEWVRRGSSGLLDIFTRRSRGALDTNFTEGDSLATLARKSTEHKITYLHRTVRDWLLHPPGNPIWLRITAASDSSVSGKFFDPHLRLLRSYILQMKHPLEKIEHHRRLDDWYPDIALSLTHARYVVHDHQRLRTKLIDELDKTISWYWLTKPAYLQDHWALNRFGTYEERRRGGGLFIPYPFLALCTRFGLEQYVLDSLDAMAATTTRSSEEDGGQALGTEDIIMKTPPPVTEETPLLHRALEFLCSRQKTIYPLSALPFVQSLLRYSRKYLAHPILGPLIGQPNGKFFTKLLHVKDVTPWIMVLRHVRDASRRGWIEQFDIDPLRTERWTGIIECLVLEGEADRDVVVRRDDWDPETNARKVLGRQGMLDCYRDWWVEDRLGRLFEETGRGLV